MRRPAHPVLTPIAWALLAAFPLSAASQSAVPRPAPPPVNAVPKPLPGWRVSGTGAAAPVNRGNASGGVDQTIDQSSQRGIYNWQSFDIGSASSVTFAFPNKDSSALNRIVGSTAPSQIFGALRSQYANPTAGGAPLVGGSIYLINANGILFGRGAKVDTGALVASTLNLTDSDFATGLASSITSLNPSFRYEGSPALFTDERNFVLVDPGATITTASGGRVFLFAKNVQNGGSIATPGGQTVLAAGSEVYLSDPTREPLYASEANPSYPALRGLLVEVGRGNGSASNLAGGAIESVRGNVTLVGMAVNQNGRISATTSVAENGSVFLLARGNTQTGNTSDNLFKHATTGGTLTLGSGSTIEIAPDPTPGSDGKLPASDASSIFTASRVELSGRTIEMKPGASLVAHGGLVRARAEVTPNYLIDIAPQGSFGAGDAAARLVIGDGASIDVSGTETSIVSVARNFVTTELIGNSDLKDAPLQKDGPLYRSRVTFDLRNAIPIFGDTSAYTAAIKRTAEEQLASGGSISLVSTGGLVTAPTSTLDVSGGKVTYTNATVKPTLLIAADGSRVTLDMASPDVQYTGIVGSGPVTIDRWGIVPRWVPAQADTGRVEPGYVEGKAGGSLTIVAPTALLDGRLNASTLVGDRQQAGTAALAAPGSVTFGTAANFGTKAFHTSGIGDLTILATPGSLPDAFWTAPLQAPLAASSRIAASTLEASGLGALTVTSDGSITFVDGAALALQPRSSVRLTAAGAGGIELGGSFRSAGGSFSARTADLLATANNGPTVSGTLRLGAGQTLDAAGDWQNAFMDGPTRSGYGGGSVTLASAHGLDLQDASRIDVSGGGTVRTNGSVVGSDAGSITLQSNSGLASQGTSFAPVHIGAVLKGQSLAGGGTLSIKAADVTVGSRPIPRGIADGSTTASLVVSDAFFDNGGFTTYQLDAIRSLRVLDGTTIAPRASNWVATDNARFVATGTRLASFLEEALLPDAQRKPVNLNLSANGAFPSPSGDLTLEAGSRIEADARASVSLLAGFRLDLEGSVRAPGGNVMIALASRGSLASSVPGMLRVGERAEIDVSGSLVPSLADGGPLRGTVLAGGNVTITGSAAPTALTPVEIRPGAVIAADGASARLAVDSVTPSGATTTRLQTVASEGGSIAITAANGGAALAGSMHAQGGGPGAAGGRFSLSLNIGRPDPNLPDPIFDVFDRAVQVQEAPVTRGDAVRGTAVVSAKSLREGFADAYIAAGDHIAFNGSSNLTMPRELVLDAQALQALPGSVVQLGGGSSVRIGGTPDSVSSAQAIGGNARLAVSGGLVELFGDQALQGFGRMDVFSASELRLHQTGTGQAGRFASLADLNLSAAQIAPTTNSVFTISAPGRTVTIGAGDASAAPPLSANGALTIQAATIDQKGVVRAPFGSIAFDATQSISLEVGSVTSVSGKGLAVPFGSTIAGAGWSWLASPVAAPREKTIDLQAPGKSIVVAPGARLDLAGGGTVEAFEFVPGPGGSKDVFAGAANGAFAVMPTISAYTPQDLDIQALAGNSGSAFRLGSQVTFGNGGPIPAGTYAVLPPRYATLPGAYLVRPLTSGTPLELGASIARPDGSSIVGGQLASAGTDFVSSLPKSFQVYASALAQRSSEIRKADANDYFGALANAAGTPVPRLPVDAGRLDAVADVQSLKGSFDFSVQDDARARGGELDISASRIKVVGSAAQGEAGVLTLATADLNATGAALLVIGGARGGDGSRLDVAASEVTVDNVGQTLQGSDIVIAATQRVELKAGASLQASAASGAPALAVSGDGALLRVSGDAAASTTRTGVVRAAGDLVVGDGSSIKGSAVVAEATHSTTFSPGAAFEAPGSLTIGASRMAVGAVDAATAGANTLILTPTLVGLLGQTASLSMRSFDGIDFYGTSGLGGTSLAALTIDTGSLRLVGAGANATISAGGVRLTNSSGGATAASAGGGTLTIRADGSGGGSGSLVVGPGNVGVSGATSTVLAGGHDLTLFGSAQFATGGDVTVRTPVLTATSSASASITAAGALVVDAQGAVAPAATGTGAHVVLAGKTVTQDGNVVLASGELGLQASGTAGGDAVVFGAASRTDLSGVHFDFDGVAVATPGGDLRVSVASGSVVARAGSLLDVSAPDGTLGRAGRIAIDATGGGVDLAGRLRAASGEAAPSGSLVIDSAAPVDLNRLAATLVAERSTTRSNFAETITVRNRSGDQSLGAGGPGLAAEHIAISSDAGALSIAGSLLATGGSEPSITLAGGRSLDILPGATVAAHGSGVTGGQVSLLSGTGNGPRNGQINLTGGTIDVGAAPSGADGSVLLRAQWTDAGNDVRIGRIDAQISGARKVEVEAVNRYTASVVDATLIATVAADNDAFASPDGSQAASILARLSGSNAALGAKLQLRNGVEIASSGDMKVFGDPRYGGWNLTRFDDSGLPLAPLSGAPTNLTLRAAGNLNVLASISDGFSPAGDQAPQSSSEALQITPAAVIVSGEGSRIRLVGGADLAAANPLATVSSATSGDVVVGVQNRDVLVRTSTGSIAVAAGRDIRFANRQAAIYTTGTPAASNELPGYVGNQLAGETYLGAGDIQSPFLSRGGAIAIDAARDVIGATGSLPQYATEWFWTSGDLTRTTGAPLWFSRYDRFNQGIATFGGGSVSVRAGRDARDVEASAATSGYVSRAVDGNFAAVQVFGGGDVRIDAGRDVVGGFSLATRGEQRVVAGRDVQAAASAFALQLVVGQTDSVVTARNSVDLGRVTPFGFVPETAQAATLPAGVAATGTSPGATLSVLAASGDLNYRSLPPNTAERHFAINSAQGTVIPESASFDAPLGSEKIGAFIQLPAADGKFEALAGKSIDLARVSIVATNDSAKSPHLETDGVALGASFDPFPRGGTPLDTSRRDPVRVVAEAGDISVASGFASGRPVRLIAGNDIAIAKAGGSAQFAIQHQTAQELSLFEAGRDIVLPASNSALGEDLKVHGPGDLVVLAGRNFNFRTSGGLGAIGNRENAALPDGSAAITVMAGVAPRGRDGTQATAWYFPLLGGTGIAGYAGDLAAQLEAVAAGAANPGLGSAAALAYKALPVDQQVAKSRQLAGAAAFDTALLIAVRRIEADASLDLAAANAAFAKLADAQRASVAAAALADAWSTRIGSAEQAQQALAMAALQQNGAARVAALVAYAEKATGLTLSPEQALLAYTELPVERRLVFNSGVLVDEVRNAGRTASSLAGSARDAAYAVAYAAIDAVFPELGPGGDVRMGSSQVRTFQNSPVTMITPRGGIDVGELSALSGKSASVLGIVTAAGGNISLIVHDNVAVNQSRVFTVGKGDLLMWSSQGNLDAGRGAKTVTGAPPPLFRFDSNGNFVVDTSGSFTGSGIAVLDASSTLDLYAPKGEINAGDAGIKSLGNAFLGAARFVGADNLAVSGVAVGAPPPAPTGGATAGLAAAAGSATAAQTRIAPEDSEEEKERKRRRRLNLILDFLGFGDGSTAKP